MNGAEEARLEPALAGETSDRADPLGLVPGPATLTVADRDRRIQLAGLSARQATKYRRTLAMLEMTDSGLRTTEIAGRLACTTAEVRRYRKQAPKTVQSVEQNFEQRAVYKPRYAAITNRGFCSDRQRTYTSFMPNLRFVDVIASFGRSRWEGFSRKPGNTSDHLVKL